MCGSTCFGRLSAHHQERTTALGASGSIDGALWLERWWSWSGRPRPSTLQPPRSINRTRGSKCSSTFLMMGAEGPETCWATHKRQVINLWNGCILLVNLFEFFCSWGIVLGTVWYLLQIFLLWLLLEIVGHDSVLDGGGGAMFTCGELACDYVVFDVISVFIW